MKHFNETFLKNKLIKLKMIEQQNCINQNKKRMLKKINETFFQLKKSLKLIYKYTLKGKKILFIGDNSLIFNLIKKKLVKSDHSWIPSKLFNNNKIIYENKKIDLIVILDNAFNSQNLEKHYSTKIPIIAFLENNYCNNKNNFTRTISKTSIFSISNFNNKFIYSLFSAVLQKVKFNNK